MIIDATAMTSADPVDITAIKIKNNIAYSPVEPSSFWATSGAAKPNTQLIRISLSIRVYISCLLPYHHLIA